MIFFDREMQESYQKNDAILELLQTTAMPNDNVFTSHQWLLDSLPKRMIYHYMYGDLLSQGTQVRKVLDVGGGYTSLTRLLLKNCDYTLLDIMAHCPHTELDAIQKDIGMDFWENADWYQFKSQSVYDLVIANDLFPNVDQRLQLFIEKFLPLCKEIRLSLTYYNLLRWYTVKRVDADEIFYMLAWNGMQVKQILEKYTDSIVEPRLECFLQNPASLFANNRQVCLVPIRGDVREPLAC